MTVGLFIYITYYITCISLFILITFFCKKNAWFVADGEQEEVGGRCWNNRWPGGDEEEAAEGPGADEPAAGGENHQLRKDGQDKDASAAGAG